MKTKLSEYVVLNNPQGASNLLSQQYGLPRTRSMKEMVSQMDAVIRRYQEQALADIAEIHPDREIMSLKEPIEEAVEVTSVKLEPSSNCSGSTETIEEKSNCDGCEKLAESKSNCCGGSSSANGTTGACNCGCGGGSSNANGTTNCGCGGSSNIAGMNYAANGEKSDATVDTTTPMSKESNVSKAITFLSAGVIGVIIAGIVFKKF